MLKMLPGKVYERIRKTYWMLSYVVFSVLRKARGDESALMYIDPMLINRTVAPDDPTLTGNSLTHIGSVQDGNWDLEGYPVDAYHQVMTILKQRVELGREYEQIPEFKKHIEEIERNGNYYHCRTKEEYRNKWRKIEELYWAIKEKGYKSQIESGNISLDEVRVQIGRNGDFLFEEGLHRLVIAQHLNLKAIPVIVTRRHKEWADLRTDVLKVVAARGYIHQPFNHPDLDTLPRLYGKGRLKEKAMYGNERWEFIANNLPVDKGKVLDIVAYFGYFSPRFEEFGLYVYAVELNENYLSVLKRYREMKNKKFVVWEKSFLDIVKFDFDIVLALNVFHHLVKQKEEYDQLVAFLNRLDIKAMFFEPHQNTESYSYKSFSDEEFIDFILTNSMLNQSRLLGRAKEGRNVYLLTV